MHEFLSDLRLRAEYGKAMTRIVFIYNDTVTIRALASVAAIGWAIGMFLPLHTFDRHGYEWLRAAAPEWVWGSAFMAYGCVSLFRILFIPERRDFTGLLVNLGGFLLWATSTAFQALSLGKFSPSNALEWALVAALFVTMIRTGRNPYRAVP